LSGEGLDQACEGYLKGRFGERKDFACQETLPSLLSYGLVTKDAQVRLRSRRGGGTDLLIANTILTST